MDQLIARIMQDFTLDLYEPIFPRELDLGNPLLPRAGNLVTVVVGMRHSGKTYRLFQEMKKLKDRGVPDGMILYFNFEDDRLKPLDVQVGDEVLDTFFELHPEAFREGGYLFLDEVQEMEDWGAWLRRVVDTRKVTVYATGSSSKLLSADVATEFRGRSIEYELLPFSFLEFAAYHEPEYFGGVRARARAFGSEEGAMGRRFSIGTFFEAASPVRKTRMRLGRSWCCNHMRSGRSRAM